MTNGLDPCGYSLAELHRAAVVATLAHRDAIATSVERREKAMSMLDNDLKLSREADIATHKAAQAMDRAEKAYRAALAKEYADAK